MGRIACLLAAMAATLLAFGTPASATHVQCGDTITADLAGTARGDRACGANRTGRRDWSTRPVWKHARERHPGELRGGSAEGRASLGALVGEE